MAPEALFQYEIEESEDQFKLNVVTIKCSGRLVNDTARDLRELVSPLIEKSGTRIVLDFSDLTFIDSAGLGALVGLKVSAIHKGLVKLELVNLTPRVLELLRVTRLTELFSK
jgi:anti-anti-sigma factor